MLDNTGFNTWATSYDNAVEQSDEEKSYPFAGYRDIQAKIYGMVSEKENAVVLDMGFGTGTLTAKLYERGCEIYGQDFSEKMIELAQEKMPDAHLYQGDFAKGLAPALRERKYDFIISTYALHHLTDSEKIEFLRNVREFLADGGKIIIGDVAFETQTDLENCRKDAGEEWDDEEFYFVAEQIQKEFPDICFQKVSYCAGLLILEKR